jgi:folate-binding protein YgfZ
MTNFPETAGVFPYAPACVLRASGPDAATFLQGQFTNDLSKLGPGQSVYGLWLDRKGRVLADSTVIRGEEAGSFLIVSVASEAAALARHLEAHIIADEVEISDETASWRGLALIGSGVGAWLAASPRLGRSFAGRRGAGESVEWIYPERESAVADAAVSGARVISREEAERMRIRAAIPAIPADVGPSDLPNEAGLEAEAISYSKGCYLGQEVMARVKSLGRVRRALVRVAGEGAAPALPAALWLGERREGELRSAVPDTGGAGFEGLALVSVASAAGAPALALAPGGPAVVKILPKG